MASVIKLRKGLNINLKGKATEKKMVVGRSEEYALSPLDFPGIIPKVAVKEGGRVLAGDPLFYSKKCPDVKFASPVSGVVSAVVRGERRKVLFVKIKADDKQEFRDYGKADPVGLTGEGVKAKLLEAGIFGYINQLPYAVSTSPMTTPKGVFISAIRDMPLAADFEVELRGNEQAFSTGIEALSKIAPVHLGISVRQSDGFLSKICGAQVHVFDGPCPTGNVGVQINHISPINKNEVAWTVDPTVVIFIGRLFLTGRVDLIRTIAVAGSQVKEPSYADAIIGIQLKDILDGKLDRKSVV